jgi:signal transduction histidine kinase
LGTVQLLQWTELNREQTEYAKNLSSAAELLRILINDILDFSKIEARKMELLETDIVHLHDLFYNSVNLFSSLTAKKGIELSCYCSPAIPIATGDFSKLTDIIVNLISVFLYIFFD